MEYINSSNDDGYANHKSESCIFCDYPKGDDDEENLILTRGTKAFVILNRYPYSTGHLMVIPYRHTSDFGSLANDEKLELLTLAQRCVAVIEATMRPDGFNLGINLGRVAGAGIDSHLHIHIVPRWNGDTNFMSVTSETKVLPEALMETRNKLLAAWQSSGAL
jgi:ATP adenylyltransferase